MPMSKRSSVLAATPKLLVCCGAQDAPKRGCLPPVIGLKFSARAKLGYQLSTLRVVWIAGLTRLRKATAGQARLRSGSAWQAVTLRPSPRHSIDMRTRNAFGTCFALLAES